MGSKAVQSAVITGASSGLGRAYALAWARRGWRIGVVDIDAAEGERTVEEIETVSTLVDFFDECYRISIVIRSTVTFPSGSTDEEVTRMLEWYAPGVGMVRREVEGGDVWELTDYLVL